jgi:excinuclease ABC subunit A
VGRSIPETSDNQTIKHGNIIKRADWIIDIGPQGGNAGGRVMAEGIPEQIKANPESITGRYL